MERLWPPPRGALLAAGVLVLVIAAAGSIAASTLTQSDSPNPDVPNELVEPRPGDNVFWPWTSTDRTVEGRTLAINVIVHGDADELRARLAEEPGATWNETEADEEDVDPDAVDGGADGPANATLVDWAAARGAKRHLYVHSYALTTEGENATVRSPHRALPYVTEEEATAAGKWIEETYQLHDGTYFGTRYHLRAYESPYESDNWTAIQAHSDHWDWFRLRHTVDGTENAQNHVESEFMGRPFVADVWRMYVYNEGSGSDGWATVIDLERRGAPSQGPSNDTAAHTTEPGQRTLWPVLTGLAGIAVLACWRSWYRETGFPDPSSGRIDADTGTPGGPGSGGDGGSDGDGHGEPGSGGHRKPDSGRRGVPGAMADDQSARPPSGVLDSLAPGLVERLDRDQLVLVTRVGTWGLSFLSICGLYLAVRAGGIFLEDQFPGLSPKVIAGTLYPFIAFGLPICAYVFGRPLDRFHGFVLASLGLLTAVVVDYGYLNVTLLPLGVVVHRFAVAVALGLIAAGATHPYSDLPTVNRWFAAGVLGWVFLLLAPLVGWL